MDTAFAAVDDRQLLIRSHPTALQLREHNDGSQANNVDWDSFKNLLIVKRDNVRVASRGGDGQPHSLDDVRFTEPSLGPSFGLNSIPVYTIAEKDVVIDYRAEVVEPKDTVGFHRTLQEVCCEYIGRKLPYSAVEQILPKLSVHCQSQLMRHSFPKAMHKIFDYSCLSNGNDEEFRQGMEQYHLGFATNVQQIGYNVLGEVRTSGKRRSVKSTEKVMLVCAEQVVYASSCTCSAGPRKNMWCRHVVAVCAYRILRAHSVSIYPPFTETLPHLNTAHLLRVLQFLIQDGDSTFLAKVQKLVTQVTTPGSKVAVGVVPDKTAGPADLDAIRWSLDTQTLKSRLGAAVQETCSLVMKSTTSVEYVNFMANAPTPMARFQKLCTTTDGEWSGPGFYDVTRLPPVKRHPQGLWHVLHIVRRLLIAGSPNSIEAMVCMTSAIVDNIKFWRIWEAGVRGFSEKHMLQEELFHSISNLCNLLMKLWMLVVLDPSLPDDERQTLKCELDNWQSSIDKQLAFDPVTLPVRQKRQWRKSIAIANVSATGPAFHGLRPVVEAMAAGWKDWPLECLLKCGKQLLLSSADILLDKDASSALADMAGLLDLCRADSLLTLQYRWKVLHLRQNFDAAVGLALCTAIVLIEPMEAATTEPLEVEQGAAPASGVPSRPVEQGAAPASGVPSRPVEQGAAPASGLPSRTVKQGAAPASGIPCRSSTFQRSTGGPGTLGRVVAFLDEARRQSGLPTPAPGPPASVVPAPTVRLLGMGTDQFDVVSVVTDLCQLLLSVEPASHKYVHRVVIDLGLYALSMPCDKTASQTYCATRTRETTQLSSIVVDLCNRFGSEAAAPHVTALWKKTSNSACFSAFRQFMPFALLRTLATVFVSKDYTPLGRASEQAPYVSVRKLSTWTYNVLKLASNAIVFCSNSDTGEPSSKYYRMSQMLMRCDLMEYLISQGINEPDLRFHRNVLAHFEKFSSKIAKCDLPLCYKAAPPSPEHEPAEDPQQAADSAWSNMDAEDELDWGDDNDNDAAAAADADATWGDGGASNDGNGGGDDTETAEAATVDADESSGSELGERRPALPRPHYTTAEDADALLFVARNLHSLGCDLDAGFKMQQRTSLFRSSLELVLTALGILNSRDGVAVESVMTEEGTYRQHVAWLDDLVRELGGHALPVLAKRWCGCLSPAKVVDLLGELTKTLGEDCGCEQLTSDMAGTFMCDIGTDCLRYGSWMDRSKQLAALELCCRQVTTLPALATALVEMAQHGSDVSDEVLFKVAATLLVKHVQAPAFAVWVNVIMLDQLLPWKRRAKLSIMLAEVGLASLTSGRWAVVSADTLEAANFVRHIPCEKYLLFIAQQVTCFGSVADLERLVTLLSTKLRNPFLLHALAVAIGRERSTRIRLLIHKVFQEKPLKSLILACVDLYRSLFDIMFATMEKTQIREAVAAVVHCRGAFFMLQDGRRLFWELVRELGRRHVDVKGFKRTLAKCVYPGNDSVALATLPPAGCIEGAPVVLPVVLPG